MTALPADIAAFTVDGLVVTSPTDPAVTTAIRAADPNARDTGDNEIEMFFDTATDAQAMLNERFAALSTLSPLHEGVEIEDRLGLGRSIAITPAVPLFTLVDETRGISLPARVRAYVFEMGSDRFSVEMLT